LLPTNVAIAGDISHLPAASAFTPDQIELLSRAHAEADY